MAALDDLEASLRKAVADGDTARAKNLAAAYRHLRDAQKRDELTAGSPGYSMSGAELGARAVRAGIEDFGVGTAQFLAQGLPGEMGQRADTALTGLEDRLRAEREGILTAPAGSGLPDPTDAYVIDLPGPVDYSPMGVGRGAATALPGLLAGAGAAKLVGQAATIPAIATRLQAMGGFTAAHPLLGAIGRGVRSVGGGAAAGAAGGASIPLSTAESDAGLRAENAETGAAIGAAVPIAMGAAVGGKRLFDLIGRDTPDEATTKLAERLGWRAGDDPLAPQLDFRRSVEQAFMDRKTELGNKYNFMEELPENLGLPPVTLPQATRSELFRRLNTVRNSVGLSTSPKAKKALEALRGNYNSTTLTVKELRDLRRDIARLQRGVSPDSPAVGELDNALGMIDDSLDQWGRTSPEAGEILGDIRKLDAEYSRDVMPFREGRISDLRGGTRTDTATVRRALSDPDTGFSYYSPEAENILTRTQGLPLTREILSKAPDAADPLRRIWGRNVTNAGMTNAARADALTSGGPLRTLGVTDTDVLTQADRIAAAYRGQDESPVIAALSKKIPLAERLLSGVPAIGEYPELARQPDVASQLAAWLLAGPAVQDSSEIDTMGLRNRLPTLQGN
jgi:hypothetical protein